MAMLTNAEAKTILLTRLQRKFNRPVAIEDGLTIERPFGWVFSVVLDDTNPLKRQPMIVNKYVHQIVASSVELRPAELVQIYESLLAQNRVSAGEWCLTLSSEISLGDWRFQRIWKKATEAGLYEIQ